MSISFEKGVQTNNTSCIKKQCIQKQQKHVFGWKLKNTLQLSPLLFELSSVYSVRISEIQVYVNDFQKGFERYEYQVLLPKAIQMKKAPLITHPLLFDIAQTTFHNLDSNKPMPVGCNSNFSVFIPYFPVK